jgi:hypothetical protein
METLQLISTVAEVVGEDFSQYFNDFVTPLKIGVGIPQPTENSVEDKNLSARMIMTLGSIIRAVSESEDKSPFTPTVLEITTHLTQLLASKLGEDDPRDEGIKETLTECAGFLGADFAQFMPHLMAPLLNDAKLNVDFKMEDAATPNTSSNLAYNVKVRGMGEQRVQMNTHAMMSKGGAFILLERISANMKSAFAPFVEQHAELLAVVAEHMTYKFNKGIRKSALKVFKNILIAVGFPKNRALFQEAVPMFFTEFEATINKKDEKTLKILLKNFAEYLKALHSSNDQARSFLTDAQIKMMGPIIKASLTLVKELKEAHAIVQAQSKANYDLDEEDMDVIQEEIAKVSKVASQTMEVTGQLVEIFQAKAEGVVKDNSHWYWAE